MSDSRRIAWGRRHSRRLSRHEKDFIGGGSADVREPTIEGTCGGQPGSVVS